MSEVIVVGEIRMSYVTVFTPRSLNGGDPKFSITVLIPKTNTASVQIVQNAIELAKQEGVHKKFGGALPAFVASPLHDGDGAKTTGEPYGPECKGHYVMAASCSPDKPPTVVAGQDRHQVFDQSEIYSGCYGYVSMHFFAYNSNGRKGVGCSLDNVWKTRDGEPLGGVRTTAEEDFGGLNIQVPPQQAQYQPQQSDTPWPNQLGGQPQQSYQQPPQTYQAPPVQQTYQQAPPQNYQQPQQGYQAPPQPAPQPVPQQIDPITGLPIGGVYGI